MPWLRKHEHERKIILIKLIPYWIYLSSVILKTLQIALLITIMSLTEVEFRLKLEEQEIDTRSLGIFTFCTLLQSWVIFVVSDH